MRWYTGDYYWDWHTNRTGVIREAEVCDMGAGYPVEHRVAYVPDGQSGGGNSPSAVFSRYAYRIPKRARTVLMLLQAARCEFAKRWRP